MKKLFHLIEDFPLNNLHLDGWGLAIDAINVAVIVKLAETAATGGEDLHLQMALLLAMASLLLTSYVFRGLSKKLLMAEKAPHNATLDYVHTQLGTIASHTETISEHLTSKLHIEENGGSHA